MADISAGLNPESRLALFHSITSNDTEPSRWNRQLSKAFDVTEARFEPASAEEALVSAYMGVEIKRLERRVTRVMSVRMGAFLTALDEEVRKWFLDDMRNLDWRGQETTPLYDTIQLNSTQSRDFLVDGMRFLRQEGEQSQRVTLRVEPRWYGLDLIAYGIRELGTAHNVLHSVQAAAKEINFLKGEAFSLSGQFLPKTGETFSDLFLDPDNAAAVQRVVQLINERGKALENRGVLLMGPPGTGKTLAARIMRNEAKSTFIWVSARDFHYAGSFGGFSEAFALARECAPAVLCFEDVDNWLYDSTVDLIKTEMDGVAQSTGVVTVMTTNYPELLPAALIDRPGRFHDVLKFDVPALPARMAMLKHWLPELPEADITAAAEATEGYSGAHLRDLARFARILADQDGLELPSAIGKALEKLATQRALIQATQRAGAHYRGMPALASQLPVRAVVTKDFQPAAMGEAWSRWNVKDLSEAGEERVIRGMATTPEADRVGDIIEPGGVSFQENTKLHLFHAKDKPVGRVTFGKPTAEGVPFEARIPKITEPGTLKDRVDEAWHSVKHGLIDAVSIGFRVVDGAYERMKNGGIRFLKTELLELSLVSVPANTGARIHFFKSHPGFPKNNRIYDNVIVDAAPGPAASGTGPAAATPLPASGVSDTRTSSARKDAAPMRTTLSEQRLTFETTRNAKHAKMVELMTAAGDRGETLSPAAQEEYDGLEAEVRGLDQHLERMTALERMQVSMARPVNGGSQQVASESRAMPTGGVPNGGSPAGYRPSVLVLKKDEPGYMFARYAQCLAATKGIIPMAFEMAKARFPEDIPIHNVLKAAVAAGTTTDPTWAGALVDYVNFAGDFIDFLRPQTIIGKFGTNGIPALNQVPFNIQVPGQTTGGEAYWVGEGKPKGVTKFDFQNVTLRWAKIANIAVLTEELVRFSNPSAERLVRNALAAAIIERMDRDFVDPTKAAVADVSPASITNGISAIPSSGTEAIDVRTDVQALFAPFIAADQPLTSGVFIMTATTALSLSLMVNALGQPEFPGLSMQGGTFMGLPVIVSQYVPTGILILVNAGDIYLSDDGQVVIDASREASLQMDDAPTNASADTASPPAPVHTQLVSLWQTNSIGIKAERFINWQRRRESAVEYLSGVAYSAGSPA